MTKNDIESFRKLCKANEFNQEEFDRLLGIPDFLESDVEEGYTPLQYAVKKNAFALAKQLVKAGANSHSNHTNSHWNSPLELAIAKNQIDLIEFMFQYGADPKIRAEDQNTLLHAAVYSVDTKPEVVKILLKKGVDPEAKNDNISAVDLAEMMGDVNQDIPSYSEKAQVMMRYIAARNKARETFKTLCSAKNVDVGALNALISDPDFLEYDMGNGYTPLQYAIACAYTQDEELSIPEPSTAIAVAKALINAGANLTSDSTGKNDYSPIALAIRANQVELVKLMLEKGVDKDFKSQSGNTLLHTAINHADDISILETLLKHGCDPTATNIHGESAVDIANEKEKALLMKYMKKPKSSMDLNSLTPIAQVLNALADDQYKTAVTMKINFNQKNFKVDLHNAMKWTAFKLHKVSIKNLSGISNVLKDVHENKDKDFSCDVNSFSPNVQKALFNIIAYAGKLSEETPSRFKGRNAKRDDKYQATIDFLRSAMSRSPDELQSLVEEYLKKPEISANRGLGLFRVHGVFAKKGKDMASTTQELFHDLNEVLLTELHQKSDSSLSLD